MGKFYGSLLPKKIVFSPNKGEENIHHENSDDNTKIISIRAGSNFVLAIDEFRCLWSWGDNSYGQLGTGGEVTDNESLPQKISYFKDMSIKYISCGKYHSSCIADHYYAYSWGLNEDGQ